MSVQAGIWNFDGGPVNPKLINDLSQSLKQQGPDGEYRYVNKNVARAMLALVILATGIICFNAVFEFEALRIATGAVNMNSLGMRV